MLVKFESVHLRLPESDGNCFTRGYIPVNYSNAMIVSDSGRPLHHFKEIHKLM